MWFICHLSENVNKHADKKKKQPTRQEKDLVQKSDVL